jgi:hypothetical protein
LLIGLLGNEILSGRFGNSARPVGSPVNPEEASTVRRHVGRLEDAAHTWTDADRST